VHCHVENSELASQLARDVEPLQITKLLRKVVEDGKGVTAAKLRSMLHAAYARAINAELSPTASERSIDNSIRTNPVTAIPSMSEFKRARDRALSKAELQEFWRRLTSDSETRDQPLALRAVRLDILLGGQRFEQLRKVEVTDVDFDAGTIQLMDPKGRRQRPRAHLLPLPSSARAEAAWLVAHSRVCETRYLLAGRTKGTALNPSTVSKLVRDICLDMLAKRQATSPFQYLDLRRTIETIMASLGVHKDVRAQIQSHGISGIQARHYDRYDYMAEKRAALELWENYLHVRNQGAGICRR
jgi:integrase